MNHVLSVFRAGGFASALLMLQCTFSVLSLPAAEPNYLLSVAAGPEETIFLADRNLPGVWRLRDGKLTIFHEASKKFRTPLNAIRCLAIDRQGRLLAGDSATRDIYRFDADGKPTPLTAGKIGIPMSIAALSNGELLVADLELQRIVRVPSEGGEPKEFAQVAAPRSLFVDADDQVWCVSQGANALLQIDSAGKAKPVVEGRPWEFPSSVVVDKQGTAFVCDTYGKSIWKVEKEQSPQKWVAGEPLVSPVSLALRGDDILVVDPRAKGVFSIDPAGKIAPLEWSVAP
jgi:hypothetical protein